MLQRTLHTPRPSYWAVSVPLCESLARSPGCPSPSPHTLPFKLCNFIFASYYVARLLVFVCFAAPSSLIVHSSLPRPFVIASCRRLALLAIFLCPLAQRCVSFVVALLPPCHPHQLCSPTCLYRYVHARLGELRACNPENNLEYAW